MSKLIAFALTALALATAAAQARVHSVLPLQTLEWPLGGEFPNFLAHAVAIDGDSIIVLVDGAEANENDPNTRYALLYRRGVDGRWYYRQILDQVTRPQSELRNGLAMKNGIAVIKLDRDIATIWQKSGGNWARANVANTIHEPGDFAISGSRILAGASGCTNDAVVYEKVSGSASWAITGRIPGDAGVCSNDSRDVELNYDYAFIRSSPTLVRSYRKEGSAVTWQPNRTINLPSHAASFPGPVAVQLGSAVSPGSAYFTRGTTNWIYSGQLMPLDFASGTGEGRKVIYRDGVVLDSEGWDAPRSQVTPYVYVANSSGGFDHVAILQGAGNFNIDFDVSGRTIVSATGTDAGFIRGSVSIYQLPVALVAPPAIANNFDARDVSGLTETPGTFVVSGDAPSYVYRQPVIGTDAVASFNNTDWQDFQYIEADMRPIARQFGESWTGIAVRYLDDDNFYFAGVSGSAFLLGRREDGVNFILAQEPIDEPNGPRYHLSMSVNGNQLIASLSGSVAAYLQAEDDIFTHGRAALATHRATADFDNSYVAPTTATKLVQREYPAFDYGRTLNYSGGSWRIVDAGLQQFDTTGNAYGIVPGPAIDNQTVTADITLARFGSTSPVAWFGLVARYVDSRNYYYLSARSSGQLQIRKVVNGVVTPLKGAGFTVAPGEMHRYVFDVRGNELTASVDGVVYLRVLDDSLARGQYGIATYRTYANWHNLSAWQR